MAVRGIIFDLDGTLIDTLPDLTAAVNAGRRAMGLPDRPMSDVRTWIGEGLPILCRRALADAPGAPAEEMIPIVTKYYTAHRLDEAAPYPGIAELLDALVARSVPTAVLSNKPHMHTVPMVETLLSRWPWTAVEGDRDADRRKPDPRTALEIVGRMGLDPGRVALVGDGDTDMETAVNAGLLAVAATWGYRDRDILAAAGAARMADTPSQVLQLLD